MNYGFGLPDEVFALTPEERANRLRGLDKVFVLDRARGFVRTLLPITLDHGSLTLGVWLEIAAHQATEAIRTWESPDYLDLLLDGVVANEVKSWGSELLGAHGSARPQAQTELPRVVDGDAVIRGLLTRTWPRDELLTAFPNLGHVH